ncbi:hypothetical protein [Gynuella sunshinyii]|uniref:Cytochrome b n=1 Tax=Gynuella sunshinyii YC6258 TaxID=1445510 RepID=A0A0C5VFC1_9GAMM|nr:hypothetical protein [Gynuella sunshinyii]AJQ92856.1 cytochrome b [Gynuella sunshinyii YC6258]
MSVAQIYLDSQGYRSIAKLYVNDFDKDGHSDILVWRKMYESRLVGELLSGFKLNSQLYGHYALIDGEYHLQQTDEATIQGWLSANELTWQKGYPSSSECQGHEGELIPEMHDPLLNDPDVLK